MPEDCKNPRSPGLRTNRAQRISGTPEFQQLHLQQLHVSIHSANDRKDSLASIHRFYLQRWGLADSSSAPPGDSLHPIEDDLFALEESAP
jgi:hypothetical protein